VDTSDFYEGKGGFQPGISFLYTRKLSEDWQLISSASYVRLNGGMTDSPLVKHKQVVSVFVGAGYRF
jgi:outer membrane scaffolding protein for murein synthesis (MipA/OmpV family)